MCRTWKMKFARIKNYGVLCYASGRMSWCMIMPSINKLDPMAMMTSSNGYIFRAPVDSPHKVQWRKALMSSLIFASTNGWANNRDAGEFETPPHSLWRHCNDQQQPYHHYYISDITYLLLICVECHGYLINCSTPLFSALNFQWT